MNGIHGRISWTLFEESCIVSILESLQINFSKVFFSVDFLMFGPSFLALKLLP